MFGRNSWVLKAVTLVFITALVASVSLMISAESAGQWVPGTANSGCPSSGLNSVCDGDSVCSDWDVDGVTEMSCCIAPEDMWTSSLSACE